MFFCLLIYCFSYLSHIIFLYSFLSILVLTTALRFAFEKRTYVFLFWGEVLGHHHASSYYRNCGKYHQCGHEHSAALCSGPWSVVSNDWPLHSANTSLPGIDSIWAMELLEHSSRENQEKTSPVGRKLWWSEPGEIGTRVLEERTYDLRSSC